MHTISGRNLLGGLALSLWLGFPTSTNSAIRIAEYSIQDHSIFMCSNLWKISADNAR